MLLTLSRPKIYAYKITYILFFRNISKQDPYLWVISISGLWTVVSFNKIEKLINAINSHYYYRTAQ